MDTKPLNRRPHRRHSPDERAQMEALFRAGATAKAIAAEFGCSERKIYAAAREGGFRRKDLKAAGAVEAAPCADQADAWARRIGGVAADAPCRALDPEAGLDEARHAAVRTAIGMLRDGDTARAYAYARLAAVMQRLDRGMEGDGPYRPSPQDEAALAFVLEKLGYEG